VTYSKAVERFEAFLAEPRRRRPRRVANMRREDVEAFLVARSDAGMRPATLSQRFRSLQQFFKRLAAEGEIDGSPMATMRPLHVPETPPPVLREAELRKLLDACAGTDFEDRRDNAITRLFLDSGMRRGELAGLRVENVDLDQEAAVVMGKGRRPRACPFGHKTGQALDRYMRVRAKRSDAAEPWLWLGKRGRLTETSVHEDRELVRRHRDRGAARSGLPPSRAAADASRRTRACQRHCTEVARPAQEHRAAAGRLTSGASARFDSGPPTKAIVAQAAEATSPQGPMAASSRSPA
jgi:site-specific recombinase XerC